MTEEAQSVLRCPQCGRLFAPRRYGQRFHSPTCRKLWHKNRTRELLKIGRQHIEEPDGQEAGP